LENILPISLIEAIKFWRRQKEKSRKAKEITKKNQQKIEALLKYEPPESREESEKYNHMFNLADQEKYFDFLENGMVTQAQLENEKLVFSHGFPSIMFGYADGLGVDPDEEVYVVTQKQWEEKNKKAQRDKKRYAIAEDMVKYLPEGTTLFIGHSHQPFEVICRPKKTRIINVGAVFDPRKVGNDHATCAIFNSTSPIDHTTIKKIKYNRTLTESKIVGLGIMDDYFERYQNVFMIKT